MLRRLLREALAPRSYPPALLLAGVLVVLSYLAFLPPGAFLVEGGERALQNASGQHVGLIAPWVPLEPPALVASVLSFLLVSAVLCLLILVAFVDAYTMQIPNGLSLFIAALGVLSFVVGPTASLAWYDHLLGALCVSLPLLVFAVVVAGAFGLGDVKLMAAAGLFLGWQLTLLAAVIGIICGGLCGLYLLLVYKKGKKEHFPFAPALCIGIATSILAGPSILTWYGTFL